MMRTTLLRSARCASSLLTMRIPHTASRTVTPGFFVKPAARLTPSLKFPCQRWYSAPANLGREEVEGRIIDILKNFDKVRTTLVMLYFQLY